MLAHRIIPTLLCRGRQLVKGVAFDSWRSVGVVAQAVRIHQSRGVDELVLLDIGATPDQRGPDLALVRELADECFMPLAVGGGVRSLDDAHALLDAGADKVVVGTHTQAIQQIAHTMGSQAVVASIDVRGGEVVVACGTRPTGATPVDWAKRCEELGAGEILLTSVDREGTLTGYDLDLIRAVADAVSIPVVAAGGCGSYAHMVQAIAAGACGVACGALFQFTDATPAGAAQYLAGEGVCVRV